MQRPHHLRNLFRSKTFSIFEMQNPRVLLNQLHDRRRTLMGVLSSMRCSQLPSSFDASEFKALLVIVEKALEEILRMLKLFQDRIPPSDAEITQLLRDTSGLEERHNFMKSRMHFLIVCDGCKSNGSRSGCTE